MNKKIDSTRPDITFYLYDYSNKLAKKPKKIYSPYNVKTLGRTPSEDSYRNPDAVEFAAGQYVLRLEEVWEKKYDQQLEWLNFYNIRWGQLSKGKWDAEYLNGERYVNDWNHIVKTEVIHDWPKPVIKTVTEKVEIQQIPKIIAETMNVGQLEKLAASWSIELPTDLREKGSAEDIKKIIIGVMSDNWNIAE